MAHLPSSYRVVTPVTVPSKELFAPKIFGGIASNPITSNCGKDKEKDWLEKVKKLLSREEFCEHGTVSWAAYRALWPAVIALLPMFAENFHSLAMILQYTM